MGNCCGNPNKTTQPATKPGKITTKDKKNAAAPGPAPAPIKKEDSVQIYGDCFSSETRTLVYALDYCTQKYNYQEVDIFQGEHNDDKYTQSVNPTGQIPTLKHG